MSGSVPAGVNVTQEDRDAAADYFAAIGDPARAKVARRGEYDLAAAVQHFAAYRCRLAATPTPPIEGRDADVERAMVTLDAFLAAYRHRPDHKLARPIADDDLLTWGDLRTILAALQALGERG